MCFNRMFFFKLGIEFAKHGIAFEFDFPNLALSTISTVKQMMSQIDRISSHEHLPGGMLRAQTQRFCLQGINLAQNRVQIHKNCSDHSCNYLRTAVHKWKYLKTRLWPYLCLVTLILSNAPVNMHVLLHTYATVYANLVCDCTMSVYAHIVCPVLAFFFNKQKFVPWLGVGMYR